MRTFRYELEIEALEAYRAADKLAAGGVEVLSMRKTQKNGALLEVSAKDRKKAFAILRGSCYNIIGVRARGLSRVTEKRVQAAGLLAGALLFFASVTFAQTRVLKVEVVGSGAYYEREVRDILAENGVRFFSAPPADLAPVRAAVLSLPRVSFCSVRAEGGVLTVRVEENDEAAPLSPRPLLCPVSGVVEEIAVVRGTALVNVGDSVEAGAVAVDSVALFGEETRAVVVIARVKIAYPFSREYAAGEREARAQVALDYGEITELRLTKTERGWLAEGVAHAEAVSNLR